MTRGVTTYDIAREAGVSRTTVSHILNNHPGITISPKTRERVLATARKLGYVPHSVAQMLVTGRSQTIGLILSRPDLVAIDAFVPTAIFGFNEACRAQGYRLLMEAIRDPESEDSYLDLAKSKRIDGLIVINPRKGDRALRKAIESKFPILIFGSSGHPHENSIGTEDAQASCRATEHLLSLGHRRIAHISYAPLVYVPANKRFEGFRKALKAADVPFSKRLFAEGNFTCESGYLAMRQILASGAHPTAVFAGNDTLALGAMVAVREAGFCIPQEFAVVGYDDIPLAAFACPPLTTIRTHALEQGKIVGEAAIALVKGMETGQRSAIVPLELIVRESCGAKMKPMTESGRAREGRISEATGFTVGSLVQDDQC
jgi:DNA-binding LacI/PurR family transcriptional regulator